MAAGLNPNCAVAVAMRPLGKAQKEKPVVLLILEHRVGLVSCSVFTQKTSVALFTKTLA